MLLKGETDNCQKLDKSNSTGGQKPVVYDILVFLQKTGSRSSTFQNTLV